MPGLLDAGYDISSFPPPCPSSLLLSLTFFLAADSGVPTFAEQMQVCSNSSRQWTRVVVSPL